MRCIKSPHWLFSKKMAGDLKHNVNNIQQGFQLPKGIAAINFMADWHEPCIHMNSVFEELSRTFPWILYFQADAEECEDLAESFGVEQVPTFVVVQDGKKVDQVVGANAPALNSMIQKHAKSNAPHGQIQSKKQEAGSTENLDEKLKNLINSQPVMIFIKGVPSAPQCGFSRQLIEILSETKCSYGSFNILEDDQVRQGLKTYSNWPTFPQVYIKGELIGGLDIVKELVASGEFEKMLPDLNARLTHLTTKAPVMLFMKGSPDVPKCIFC